MRLAELGADVNFIGEVSEICSDYIDFCCIIIVMLAVFFEIVWIDGLDVGCREGSMGSLCETG